VTTLPSPVLLTGATGFIGRHLHRHLLDRGVAVRALVRPASAGSAHLDPRCQVVSGALDDAASLDRALDGVAAVVYGAGAVRGRRFEDFASANVAGVQALVSALDGRTDVPLVLLSSLAASRPELSHYAASKRAGEQVLEQSRGLCWTILRPPAVYGPGDVEMRPLLDLVRRGLAVRPGPPDQRLALLHVDDLVAAVAAALAHPEACRGQTFALDDGTADGYSWQDIGMAVAGRRVRELGVPAPLLRAAGAVNVALARVFGYLPMLSPGKARELQASRWLCDNRAFTHATGWRPQTDLARGARALFAHERAGSSST